MGSSQGNMAAGVDLNQTSEAGKQALISYLIKLADHRSNRALLEAWADNSFEALAWFKEAASAGGIEVNPDEPQADRTSTATTCTCTPTPTSASAMTRW